MAFYGDGKHNEDMEYIEQKDTMQQLTDEVIDKLKQDFLQEDYTVLEELLMLIPVEKLIQALPEREWEKYKGKF